MHVAALTKALGSDLDDMGELGQHGGHGVDGDAVLTVEQLKHLERGALIEVERGVEPLLGGG